jgi:hypothetical protein
MPSRLKSVCAELNTLSQRFSKNYAADEQPLAALGGGGRRTHRADKRGAALHAAVGDVFKLDAAPLPSRAGSTDANIIL